MVTKAAEVVNAPFVMESSAEIDHVGTIGRCADDLPQVREHERLGNHVLPLVRRGDRSGTRGEGRFRSVLALPEVRSQVGRMVEVPLKPRRDGMREQVELLTYGFNNLFDRVYELERKVRILEGKGSIIKEVMP